MAKVIGFEPRVFRKITCQECAAIVEYAPNEQFPSGSTDEGVPIVGIDCPNCKEFIRTNA